MPPSLRRGKAVDLSEQEVSALCQSVGLKTPGAEQRGGGRRSGRAGPAGPRSPEGGPGVKKPRGPRPFGAPGAGNRGQEWHSPSSGARVRSDDRPLVDDEDLNQPHPDDEWQPSGPDAHLSHLGGGGKKRPSGPKKPNPLQTSWGSSKPASGALSAPQRPAGAGRPGQGRGRKGPAKGQGGGGRPQGFRPRKPSSSE